LSETPDRWPPLAVVEHGGRLVLVDGFHRFAAAQALRLGEVPIQVLSVPEGGDLLALAFSLNSSNGRALTLADRRAFAVRLLQHQPQLSDRDIGRRSGLSGNTVGGLRRRLEVAAQSAQHPTPANGTSSTAGTTSPTRQLGVLPEPSVVGVAMDTLAAVFTGPERRKQTRIARYLQRLAVALEDSAQLPGWETDEDAADACRVVLGEETAAELAGVLGYYAAAVLDVAVALGYELVGHAAIGWK
jgi:hypothetical protein